MENNLVDDQTMPAAIHRPARQWVDAGGGRAYSLASYLEIPFLHKRLILSCLLLGMLAGWVALLVWPRSYESEAKMMMRVGRESVSLDPTATTSPTMILQKTQEEEIVSALEVLGSRQVSENVVDKLGADAILSGILPADVTRKSSDRPIDGPTTDYVGIATSLMKRTADSMNKILLSLGVKDDIGNRELAIRKLQSSVWIHSPRKSTVICVGAQAKTPTMAQAIVKSVIDSFLTEHSNGSFTNGSLEFFREQSRDVEEQLNTLVQQRSGFMQEHKIVSIDANRELLKNQLSGIDRDLVVASGQLEQAVSEVEDLISKEAVVPDDVVAQRLEGSDSTWSGMRQRIYELELELQKSLTKYTDDHPSLKRIREQLKGAQDILRQLNSERTDLSTTPNPVKVRLGEELQKQQTKIVGLESAIAEKENRQANSRRRITELLEYERHLTEVDREIRLRENSLELLRQKMEEARIIDELHSKKISNVHVFQPATFVERPVSPQKKILAFGFLFLGLTTGLGLSLLGESTSPLLRTKEDVESQLWCPVVANIPQLKGMESPRLKDKKLYSQKCEALIAEILLAQRRPHQTRGRSLGIIGIDVGAGASTLAVSLAMASSHDCRMKTVLVDADGRQRSVSKMFGLNGRPGLVELVSGSASHDECLQRANSVPIDLVASAADSCEEILTSSAPEIVQALQAYLHDSDILIVDLPAASQPDQAIALAQHLDFVLVVIESGKTKTADVDRLLRCLSQGDTQVVGVVLNKTRSYLPRVLRRCVAPQV